MRTGIRRGALAALTGTILLSSNLFAQESASHYPYRLFEVTITNITKSQILTPILAAAHKRKVKLFELGQPASSELEQLAEGGDTEPLEKALKKQGAPDVVTSDGPLPPGKSVTLLLKGRVGHTHVSVASMLIPTNDTFFAANSVRTRRPGGTVTILSPGYDAGTELNDESCRKIPGPACGGEGYNPEPGEGFVHVNSGIHGIGDLLSETYDWRNPVARITIKTRRQIRR